jgi:hypothetical protein
MPNQLKISMLLRYLIVFIEGELLGIAMAEKFFHNLFLSLCFALPIAFWLSIWQLSLPLARFGIRGQIDVDKFHRSVKDTSKAYEVACIVTLIVYVLPFDALNNPLPFGWGIPLGLFVSWIVVLAFFTIYGIWKASRPLSSAPL